MTFQEELDSTVNVLATTNARLAVNARVNCGRELTPFRMAAVDSMLDQRQAALQWFADHHILVEVGDSVWRSSSLTGWALG